MKTGKIFHLLSLLTLLATLFAIPTGPAFAADPVVRIVPAAATVHVNETVVISVVVENVANLFGAEFHLEFDPNMVEVVDADPATDGVQITPGTFLSPDFIAQNQASNVVGTVDFAVSQMAPKGPVSGSGTLATITFRGLSPGVVNVTIRGAILANQDGQEIPSSRQHGTITVPGEQAPSPLPTPIPPTPAPGTPTPTPVPPTVAPPPGNIQGYHVVRRSETLYSIGRAYATRPHAIASANGIVNPSRIYVGMRLAIPVAPWSPIPAGPVAVRQFTPGVPAPTPPPSPPVPGCRFYHTVRRSDTLTRIAIRYGSNIWAIGRANNIYNLNLIFPGQVLCIP